MRERNTSSLVGITLGDPAGIGPEIVARTLSSLDDSTRRRFVVFGDRTVLDTAFRDFAQPPCPDLAVVDTGFLKKIEWGRPNADTGRAQVLYLEQAVAAAKSGTIGAVATAPIHKAWAARAGFGFPGHTEYLAAAFDAHTAMLFAGPRLRVLLATVHLPLAEVARQLTHESLCSTIALGVEAMRRDFGHALVRVGVLGLNPHAGEEGKFGDEESRIIEPAIRDSQRRFANVARIEGPLVPDAAFRQPYDLHVAMYHDQGLIPVKLVDFEESVNTTLGLPIVRTSPDHGVAYDIAGRGCARPTSMQAAARLALQLLDHRLASSPRHEGPASSR